MLNKKVKAILLLSIIINILLLGVLTLFIQKQGGINYVKSVLHIPYDQPYDQNPQYVGRTGLFKQLNIPENSIVFLGDSLTQRSSWNEMFNSNKIINRGIESDTTEGVLHRLDDITKAKPNKIFLMIGINDLRTNQKVSGIVKNYSEILKSIHEQTPNTEVYIQSVLPVNNEIIGKVVNNDDVLKLNDHLRKFANEYNYKYIDLYSKVSTGNQLKSQLTIDGIHLKGEGYKIWKENIKKYVYK